MGLAVRGIILATVAGGAGSQAGAQASAPASAPATVERPVDALLARMTFDEKFGLLGGVDGFDVPGLARLGIPRLGTADSPFGVRARGPSTVYAGGIALAATWNPALAERVGTQLGRDARARGKHYSLGPGVNIYRAPLNGRNFEYFGEDPWLASRVAVGFIRGVQSQGVSSTVKHYLGNNSEYARNSGDSRIEERALREIYLPAFEAAVQEAGVGAVMPAYNLTNGAYMTANRRLLADVAKGEFGFRGVMMSDWGAVHSALDAAVAGMDLEMPGPQYFNRDSLAPLVRSGAVPQAAIDDKVRRLLRNVVRFGWMERSGADSTIPRDNPEGHAAALDGAREALVLLKNDRGVLPLDAKVVRTVAVIGPNATPAVIIGGGSAAVPPFHAVSIAEGVQRRFPGATTVRGIPTLAEAADATAFTTAPTGGQVGLTVERWDNPALAGPPARTAVEAHVNQGQAFDFAALALGNVDPAIFRAPPKVSSARWTGYFTPGPAGTPAQAGTYDVFVQQGGFGPTGYRLYVDGTLVRDRWDEARAVVDQLALPLDARPHKVVIERHVVPVLGTDFFQVGFRRQGTWVDSSAVRAARGADAVVLAVGFGPASESEGWDRTFQLPPGQDELIRAVAAANPRTVVVFNSGGAVDMTRWVDAVPAVLAAWYPGEAAGTAFADIVTGAVNPSGHLPATFERRWEDNPVYDSYYPEPGTNRVPYREGVFVGYRGYERNGTAPLFPFGHGLSYTTFRYANLAVTPAAGSAPNAPRYDVAFDVTNAGARAGAVVAQVYVSDAHAAVARPPKELKGFAKVMLQPGETRRVRMPLDLRSLAYYDVGGRQWRADAGTFTVRVGNSSADLPLTGTLALPRTVTRAVAAR